MHGPLRPEDFVVMMIVVVMMMLMIIKVKMKISRRNLERFRNCLDSYISLYVYSLEVFIVFCTSHIHFSNGFILPQWCSIALAEDVISVEYKASIPSMDSHTFESWHTLLLSLGNYSFFYHLSNSNLTFNT